MGVDDAKRRRLVLQVQEKTRQHDVLDDVSKIPGVKGVAVVQKKFGSGDAMNMPEPIAVAS